MLRYIFTSIFVFLSVLTFSQHIMTKDGLDLGSRAMFIEACAEGATEESIEIGGEDVDFRTLCGCMADRMIPMLTSAELIAAQASDGMEALLMRDDIFPVVIGCVTENIASVAELEVTEESIAEGSMDERFAMKSCVESALDEDEVFTRPQAVAYCECALQKIRENGYKIADLLQAESEDSEVFNEVVIPCVVSILEDAESLESIEMVLPEPSIEGNSFKGQVPLSELNGQYRVKIEIGEMARYYLLDTGASDLVINSDFERELLLNGVITMADYAGTELYEIANGEVVEAPLIVIPELKIGDFTIRNLPAAVLDGGGLCGMSLLNLFDDWRIDRERASLILKR